MPLPDSVAVTLTASPVVASRPWEGPPRAFAGVGSRETPREVCDLMGAIGTWLRARGHTCRSGGAGGADEAFREAATVFHYAHGHGPVPPRLELYLPCPNWRGHHKFVVKDHPMPMAHAMAASVHSAWSKITVGRRRDLLARTSYVIMGRDLISPVAFVACWTPDDAVLPEETSEHTGGTGQAIRLAGKYGIPVYNLARPDHAALWQEVIR